MHHPRLEENVLKDQTSHFFNFAKCHHKSDKYVFCKKKKNSISKQQIRTIIIKLLQ